ncbi:MAG: hypothetical protein H0W50_10200 [Parachlamydiaceae bacterium]|nr:hypothetical protein [Parachlamydiaceae bacterium]
MSEIDLKYRLDLVAKFLEDFAGTITVSDNHFYLTTLDDEVKKFLQENKIDYKVAEQKQKIELRAYLDNNVIEFGAIEQYLEPDCISGCVILSASGKYYYQSGTSTTITNGLPGEIFYVKCRNAFAYYLVFDQMATKAYADHYNEGSNEFVYYSSTYGILRVPFDTVPKFDESKDHYSACIEVLELCSQPIYKSFFVNALYILSKQSGVLNMKDLISEGKDIVNITKRDYELAARKFDFVNFKNSLFKGKPSAIVVYPHIKKPEVIRLLF